MTPRLDWYDWIVVNSSAGKDSQAMLDYVVCHCDYAGVSRSRIVVLHCDLGLSPNGEPIEWPGTKELAEQQAEHYGLRFIVCRRTRRGFLEEIRKRGLWPSNGERYCTSYFKREEGVKVLTMLARETAGPRAAARILNCFGFRAEESPRRRRLQPFVVNKRATTGRKIIHDWLPIQSWTVREVWDRIEEAGTPHHYAYDRGMTRLSCRFCIFAPLGQLMVSARENPELFAEYLQLERDMGHSFRINLPLAEVDRLVKAGEAAPADDGAWNM